MADSGAQGLDAMIARVRGMRDLAERAAKIAAPELLAEAKRTAQAGVSPSTDQAWRQKKGGGRALVDAASALSVRVLGPVVQIVLKGPYVLHNFGTGHAPRRPILPERGLGLPQSMRTICYRAVAKAMHESGGA